MNKEKIYLIACPHCKKRRQTIIRSGHVYKKSRECYYCKKNFKLNKDNVLGRLR